MSKEKYFSLIRNYIKIEFGGMGHPEDYIGTLEEPMALLMLCNNTKKQWPSTEGLDFGLVREVLYNFKLKTLEEFMQRSQYAFLYQHYFEAAGFQEAGSQKEVPQQLFYQEMVLVNDMAMKTAKSEIKEGSYPRT